MDLREIILRECPGQTPHDFHLIGALMTANYLLQKMSDDSIEQYLDEFKTVDVSVLNSPTIYATFVIADEIRRDRQADCVVRKKDGSFLNGK